MTQAFITPCEYLQGRVDIERYELFVSGEDFDSAHTPQKHPQMYPLLSVEQGDGGMFILEVFDEDTLTFYRFHNDFARIWLWSDDDFEVRS